MKKKLGIQDAISYKEAAQIAGVTSMTVWNWVDENILERYEIAEHPAISKTELLLVLEERKKNRKGWKQTWLKEKERCAHDYPVGKE